MRDRIFRDLLYTFRTIRTNPGFTLVAVCTLALGIGTNTAIFTVSSAVLLRPLPYQNPDGLALLSISDKAQPIATGPFSYPRLEFLQAHSRSFSAVAGFTTETFNLTGRGDAEQLSAARVSAAFFDVLGVRPVLGRGFAPQDDKPGAKDVVLISHALWTRKFAAQKSVIGQVIDLDSKPFIIVGVTPPAFQFGLVGSAIDVWAAKPFELNIITPEQVRAGAGFLNAVARLRNGATLEQAQAEMDVLARQYVAENPKVADANPRFVLSATNLQQQLVANVRPALLALIGAVGLVLLIACANVASLLLARAVGRRKEIAVRMAIGASRGAVVSQLLMESLVLGLIAGFLGVMLSAWATGALGGWAAANIPRVDEIRTDGFVLVFAVGVSVLTGILFGLVPALQMSRTDVNSGLREESRGSTGPRTRQVWRSALVVSQVALSLVLLIGSGLLIRSFKRLVDVSPGFQPANLLTMSIALPPSRYRERAQMISFYDELVTNVEHLPGVRAAAVTSGLPLNPSRFTPVLLEGQPEVPLAQRPVLALQMVSPDYFAAMGTSLLSGRTFQPADTAQAALVAIVNQALARRYWPNDNPLGKHIHLGRSPKAVQVVGVAADVKNIALAGETMPEIDLPYPQLPWRAMNLIVRTSGDPNGIVKTVKAEIAKIDRDQPVTAVQTGDELLSASRAQPRFTMFLLGVFAATSFVLAVVGLYGTLSYSVAQRTYEMGIRIAVGAQRQDLIRMVLREGLMLTSAGLIVGLGLSIALTRILATMLFQTSSTDLATFTACAFGFVFVAALASAIPAARATRVDPSMTLR